MDRVRFGRVLGKGARLAAQTAIEAVDAATSTPDRSVGKVQPDLHRAAVKSVPRAGVVLPPASLTNAVRGARRGVTAPLREASRALWHELTGSFFAIFALSFAVGVWRTRADAWSEAPADRHRLIAFFLLALLFFYFSVSSFLRARKQPRR